MINQDSKRFIYILKFWSLFFQAFNNCQQFFVVNFVIALNSRMFNRKVSHGFKGFFIVKL
jgi:hypothetical protein